MLKALPDICLLYTVIVHLFLPIGLPFILFYISSFIVMLPFGFIFVLLEKFSLAFFYFYFFFHLFLLVGGSLPYIAFLLV